jgi:hypothetical protein
MSLAMTRQEREAFLADVHVGIISEKLSLHSPPRQRTGHTAVSPLNLCRVCRAGLRAWRLQVRSTGRGGRKSRAARGRRGENRSCTCDLECMA